MSDYTYPVGRQMIEREQGKVWLRSSFRVKLIKMGLDKAGSMNGLAREMGYRSRVHPGWSVLQILLGNQAFPSDKLKRLANYLEVPYDEIIRNELPPRRITPQSTREALIEWNLMCYLPK